MRDSFGFFLTAEGAEGAEEEKRERERGLMQTTRFLSEILYKVEKY
jgi:hypothetical protein